MLNLGLILFFGTSITYTFLYLVGIKLGVWVVIPALAGLALIVYSRSPKAKGQ